MMHACIAAVTVLCLAACSRHLGTDAVPMQHISFDCALTAVEERRPPPSPWFPHVLLSFTRLTGRLTIWILSPV